MLVLAITALVLVGVPPASGGTAAKNGVALILPSTAKAGEAFVLRFQVGFNPRDHNAGAGRMLEAAFWLRRGTDPCPKDRLPRKRDGWEQGNVVRYSPGSDRLSDNVQQPTLEQAGRVRFCAYVYVKRFRGGKLVGVTVKARDAELLRVTP